MKKELQQIYERITSLRKQKVKMKDMAEQCRMAPGVFSAIYTTVIPAYLKNTEKGQNDEEALSEALIWVNNVSRKRLVNSLAFMLETLEKIQPPVYTPVENSRNPFLSALSQQMEEACQAIEGYAGTYMSYSLSSSRKAMKEEPYLIGQAVNQPYVEVLHNSVYGSTHRGYALMNGLSHLYLEFNELPSPQLALYNICLKLPMYDKPPFLRGVYTCFDYNYNPVARRILLVKKSDSTDREEFKRLKGRLITEEELTEEEKIFYKYTCDKEDIIRLHNIREPQMTFQDLQEEKHSLNLLH